MVTIPNNDDWRQLLDNYRELPELWKVKSELFKDKHKKRIAWTKLLESYRRVEPASNVDTLKKRISNIKTCYRRELKKVELSQRSGAGSDEEYIPSLWYFDRLEFLRDQETQIPGLSTIDIEEVDEAEEAHENVPAANSYPQKRKKTVGQHLAERNDLLKDALGQLSRSKKPQDDASIHAESWAVSYRKLSEIQQIYAKKAIEEILVLGQLELLNLHSVNSSSTSSNSSASLTPLQLQKNPPSSFPSKNITPVYRQSLSSTPLPLRTQQQVSSCFPSRTFTPISLSSTQLKNAKIIPTIASSNSSISSTSLPFQTQQQVSSCFPSRTFTPISLSSTQLKNAKIIPTIDSSNSSISSTPLSLRTQQQVFSSFPSRTFTPISLSASQLEKAKFFSTQFEEDSVNNIEDLLSDDNFS